MPSVTVEKALEAIRKEQAELGSVPAVELDSAIESLVRTTAETYSRDSDTYTQARTAQPWSADAYMTDLMLSAVRSKISEGKLPLFDDGRWRMLDVGAGYGRDVLRFSQEHDIAPIALEYAEGFVSVLRRLQEDGQLGPDAVVPGDMRSMDALPDGSFQCVRNHATLHHLPLVRAETGADAAVRESRRVLMKGGVFYVLAKAGAGVSMIDTKEGLGGRFFQLFTPSTLESLLERHGFKTMHIEELIEPRGSAEIPWVFALAEAE